MQFVEKMFLFSVLEVDIHVSCIFQFYKRDSTADTWVFNFKLTSNR